MANNGKCEDYIHVYVITLIAPDKREYQDIFFYISAEKMYVVGTH